MMEEDLLKSKIPVVHSLYKKGEFNKAYQISEEISNKYINNSYVQNLHGVVCIALNNWETAKNYFIKALKIKNNFSEAYNNLGLSYLNLGNLEDALKNFLSAIEIKSDYASPHNNILKILTYFDSKNNNNNQYVLANNQIKNIKFDYNEKKLIKNSEIINFYKEAFDIVHKNISNIETSETQIYRHNSIDLNCSRHFRIFNEFNAIPKFCFDCFKVSVEAKTVLDLMKLYFVFDKLYPDQKYSRKLMIESRQDVSGNYKGFIYCSNVEEGENIQIKLKKILINNIGNDCSISLKRGCSEFSLKYPSYKKASKNKNEMMPYDKTWEQKEEIIDNKIYNSRSKKDKIYSSLNGYFLRDILVMRNWLIYAKEIGDNSYIEA